MDYIDIDLGNGRSISIDYSGGLSKYRYDIYIGGVIQGAVGMDKIVEDVNFLNSIVDRYLEKNEGGF